MRRITIMGILTFCVSLMHAQKNQRSVLNFNHGWSLYTLTNAQQGKIDPDVKRDASFNSQFDTQYMKANGSQNALVQEELAEALAGFGSEYDKIQNQTWQPVSLPSTVRYETALNPGPKSFQGIAYYRKTFTVPQSLSKKELSIYFEGAMQTASVWFNGKFVLQHRGGYTPFTVPLKGLVKLNGSNEIVVRLDNRDDKNTPPGKPLNRHGFLYWSGIYRDAWLVATDRLHITDAIEANLPAGGGVFIRTENVSEANADLIIKTQLKNDGGKSFASIKIVQRISDATGKSVAVLNKGNLIEDAGGTANVLQRIKLVNPKLWSPDTPNLYLLVSEIYQNNKLVDRTAENFGIRDLAFSRTKGFSLNGKSFRINGTNLHQDYPFIGNAVSNRSHLRDLIKIKNAGFNFVRLPHYPHDPSVFRYCDSLGLMVANPIPGWQFFNDTELFKQRVFRDIRDMVRRDRNHPCVIMWEVSLNESPTPANFKIACVKVAKEEFPGNQFFTSGDIGLEKKDIWDVAYNGWKEPFGRPQDAQPNTASFVREYGDYEFGGGNSTTRKNRSDGQAALLQSAWNLQWEHNLMRSSSYYPWTIGDANWAFYDGAEGWTDKPSDWGIADAYHIPKFSYYFYRSQMPSQKIGPMLYIANWWNVATGPQKVIVYSNCDSVALYLNNRLLAMQKPDQGPDTEYGNYITGGNAFDGGNARNLDHPPFTFNNIGWQTGTLRAIGFLNGQPAVNGQVLTPLASAGLTIAADTGGLPLQADNADAVFVHASIVDKNGTVLTLDNQTKITFEVMGPAVIVSPKTVRARAGIASVLLKSTKLSGKITVVASTDNKRLYRFNINSQKQ